MDNSKYSFANEQGFRRPADVGEAAEGPGRQEDSSGSEGFCEERGAGVDLGDPELASDWSDEGIRVSIEANKATLTHQSNVWIRYLATEPPVTLPLSYSATEPPC